MEEMVDPLSKNKTLRSLILRDNAIQNEHMVPVLDKLTSNRTIRRLDLDKNNINHNVIKRLKGILEMNRVLARMDKIPGLKRQIDEYGPDEKNFKKTLRG